MKFIINVMQWTDMEDLLYIMLHGKWLHVHVSVSFTVVLYFTTMLFSIRTNCWFYFTIFNGSSDNLIIGLYVHNYANDKH